MSRYLRVLFVVAALSAPFVFAGQAPAASPTVTIDPNPTPSYTTIQVTGTIDPADQAVTAYVEYTTDPSGTWLERQVVIIPPGSGPTPISYELNGLTPGTQYYIRLDAWNNGYNLSSEVTATTLAADLPGLTIDPPSAVTATTAHFSGEVDTVTGLHPAPTNWHFRCQPECPGLTGGGVAAGDNSTVEANATGLVPGTTYLVTLVGENPGGQQIAGPETFTTLTTAPTIVGTGAAPLRTEAVLKASVNPGGAQTTYHFEYGPSAAYGQSTESKTLGAGGSPVGVRATIDGLAPVTTYHYRLVATNINGTVEGPDLTFTTEANAESAENCPNAAIRALEGAQALPECRAYEQVSPPDKGSYTIQTGSSENLGLATNGNAIGYFATGSFSGSPASLWATSYLATRGADNWTSTPVSRPVQNPGTIVFRDLMAMSPDGTHAVIASNRALAPGAVAGEFNLYLEDIASGHMELIAGVPTFPSYWEQGSSDLGGTPDFSHVLLVATEALTPDAINNGNPKLYEFTSGHLRLVSYVPTEGGGEAVTPAVVDGHWGALNNAISSDGSRIFFSVSSSTGSPGNLGLYVRIDGQHTVAISRSKRAGEVGEVKTGVFRGAGNDGGIVYFMSTQQLTDESSPTFGFYRFYKYEVASERLTEASAPGGAAETLIPNEPFAMSADGNSAAFYTNGNYFYWSGDHLEMFAEGGDGGQMANTSQRTLRVSPNGLYVAFLQRADLTGYDTENSERCLADGGDGLCQEAYLYDVAQRELVCVSCNENGEMPQGHATFGVGDLPWNVVTDQGRVYFDTPDKLDPRDTNGRRDVYEYFQGRRALISAGRGALDARFYGATANGSDVFFTTDLQLVGQDKDQLTDLYDARVDGGLLGQNPLPPDAPCAGEGCLGSAGSPPPSPGLASAGIHAAPKAAAKRCVKPKKRQSHRGGARQRGRKATTGDRHGKKPAKKCGKQAGR